MSSHSSTSIIKFADDTVVLGLINNDDETAYLDEVERLTSQLIFELGHMSLNNFRTLNECNTENACNVKSLNEVISVFTLQNKSSPCHLRAVANWMLRLAVDSS